MSDRKHFNEDQQGDWFSNKDLFIEIRELQNSMVETKHLIKQYNGLYDKTERNAEDINELQIQINKVIDEQQGKIKHTMNLYQLSGWLFGLISIIVLLITNIFL